MVEDILRVKCPACGKFTIADLLTCGCIMAKCEHCGIDFENTKECAN